mmetsp:Transcript_5041/g.12594  ORF Transcript_5041/g.12594 Transcript_5041/m.12594 type:complete len:99 (+) Transcript_5041:1-297(+)
MLAQAQALLVGCEANRPNSIARGGMDKICRGSTLGEAQRHGAKTESSSVADTSRHARGTHVSCNSYKLETSACRDNPGSAFVSDTFRSQEWFKHGEWP